MRYAKVLGASRCFYADLKKTKKNINNIRVRQSLEDKG
jgi:hypothetical protein